MINQDVYIPQEYLTDDQIICIYRHLRMYRDKNAEHACWNCDRCGGSTIINPWPAFLNLKAMAVQERQGTQDIDHNHL